MKIIQTALTLGRSGHQWLFRRNQAEHPSVMAWIGVRVSVTFIATGLLALFFHSRAGQGGQFLGTGMIHAIPGIPEHEFWCVLIMGSLMRVSIFALLLFSLYQGVFQQSVQREKKWQAFQGAHGSDRFSQLAFAHANGGTLAPWAAHGVQIVFVLASLTLVLPQPAELFGISIANDDFLGIFFNFMLMIILVFVFLLSIAITIFTLENTLVPLINRVNMTKGASEKHFEALPQSEKNRVAMRAKALGLNETTPALRREAVRSYNERIRQAQEQSLAIDHGTPKAHGNARSRRL